MGRPLGSRYVIEEQIGRGGMGEVFRAVNHSGNEYAAKVLRSDLANDQAIVTRFVQERSILLSVRHRNLVAVHDLVVEGETLAIVMDLVRGPDLRHALQGVGNLPPAEVARLGGGIAAGLAAVHAADVVHRDIKPENILLDQADQPPTVRLTDFGISRLFGPGNQVRTTMLMGTPLYLAPEIAHGGQAGPATDLYSLGIVLYELCCGVSPFFGGEVATVIHWHTALDPGRPDGIPDPLWDLIRWMLAKLPEARPQSAAQVAGLLGDLEQRLAGLPAAPLIAQPPRGRLTTHPFPAMQDDYGSELTVHQPPVPPPAGYGWSSASPYPGASPYPAASPYPGASPYAAASFGHPATPVYPPGYLISDQPGESRGQRALVAVGVVLALLLAAGGVAWAVAANQGGDGAQQVADGSSSAPGLAPSSGPGVTATPDPTLTPSPEATPSPTPTPTPTPTPVQTPIFIRDVTPEDFVRTYYDLAPDDPEEAFSMYTASRRASSNYEGYLEYWGLEVDSVDVHVGNVDSTFGGGYTVVTFLEIHKANGETDYLRVTLTLVPVGDSFGIDDLDNCESIEICDWPYDPR